MTSPLTAVARLPWASTAAVLLVQLVGSHFAARDQPERVALDPGGYALLAAGPLLLLARRRHPAAAAWGTAALTLLYLGAGYPYGPVFLSVLVATFGAAVAGERSAAWGALGTLWLGRLISGHWLHRWLPPEDDGPVDWASDTATAAWIVALLALAELARARGERHRREERERAEAARRRADEERLRIARELHDILAHSISVIHVQAGVGLALLDSDTEQARASLTTIKAASKEALGEVRQVLQALRAPGAAPRAPSPGVDRLPELLAQARDAGLEATLTTEGRPTGLPPGADLAAFRIVQEALTNTVRHSASRTARVRLAYTPDGLRLTVDDEGPATGDPRGAGGNGLVGMRERAAALGGGVTATTRDDGGFTVTADLPYGPPGPPAHEDTTPRENG
ncbi:Histidine kinase [Streptomyces zhaozhouensis]|uniref:histidine kinase n=1 Tax=Streptomyces zhaozhouensis TaxID=1300267 RepID=A0A286DWK3_9ACTN|nr:sensor histidine kinase [Streptomyces zhaozhouensis]SOD63013.1 Histidine kinase [Streptomyces zhaozhouensis]